MSAIVKWKMQQGEQMTKEFSGEEEAKKFIEESSQKVQELGGKFYEPPFLEPARKEQAEISAQTNYGQEDLAEASAKDNDQIEKNGDDTPF